MVTSSINANVVLRQSNILELFKRGTIPTSVNEIQAATKEILQAKAVTQLPPGDVHITIAAGGGGYGDPLKRNPELVCRDVANCLVTMEVAKRVYGVILKDNRTAVDSEKMVDYEQTARERERILAERKARARAHEQTIVNRLNAEGIKPKDLTFVHIISDFLEVRASEVIPGTRVICCSSCGGLICTTDANIHDYTVRSRPIPMDFLSSVNSLCINRGPLS